MTLFWLVTAWLTGIAAGAAKVLTASQWSALAAVSLAALLLLGRFRLQRFLFALLLAGFLGAVRSALQPLSTDSELAGYNDSGLSLEVQGQVIAFPEPRESYTGLTVEVDRIRRTGGQWTDLNGRLLARADPYMDWSYGDRVELSGRLETPPQFEGFSYRRYLAHRGILSLMDVERASQLERGGGSALLAGIYQLRASGLDTIQRLFPQPEASLLAGILLGIETGIPRDVRRAFDATGTTHIIAISGFNITIVAGIFVAALGRWLGARRGALAAALSIAFYTALVGADAAVVRAALMGGLSLAAQMLGRRAHGYASLAAAALAMTAFDPHLLWDVGFQLSFAATLGMLIYGDRFQHNFERVASRRLRLSADWTARLKGPVTEYLLMTLAAQLTTLPLMLYHFGRLSLISPLANLLVLPVQPAVMILGGIATVAGTLWQPLGTPLAWIAWPFPAYTIRMAESLAALPAASQSFPPISWFYLIPLYGGIGLATWGLKRDSGAERSNLLGRIPAGLSLAALGLVCVLLWRQVFTLPDRNFHLTLLAVSEGQGLLLETPDGRYLLIDGGASSVQLGEALDRRLSPFNRSLDWVVVSEAEESGIGGLSRLIERYYVGGALIADAPGGTAYRRLSQELLALSRPVGQAHDGMALTLGDGARLEFVKLGESELALWIEYDRVRLLLAPGAGAGWLETLPPQIANGQVTAVLPPDGGDATLSPAGELLALRPQVILLSIPAGNRRGLPPRSLMEASEGRTILRTDENGWIELTTDGHRLWGEVERTPQRSPLE